MRKHNLSLSGQFIVVWDAIICFSVRFCDDPLPVLKMYFQVFFFPKQKGTRVFQWQENINVVVISTLSSTKPCLSCLKF